MAGPFAEVVLYALAELSSQSTVNLEIKIGMDINAGVVLHILGWSWEWKWPVLRVIWKEWSWTLRHDVAITRVTPSKKTVYTGECLRICVNVENQGNFSETFYVTAYYNTYIIGKKSVALCAEGSKTLTFFWDTTGVCPRSYIIKAEASTVQNEEDTTDNVYIDGCVEVKTRTWILFNLDVNPATPGASVTLTGILADESSNVGANVPIKIAYSIDDGATWTCLWTLMTDSYGIFSKTFLAPEVGRYLLRASWTGSSGYMSASSTTYLIVLSSTTIDGNQVTAGAICFNFLPNPAALCSSCTLRGILLDDFGQSVASEDVTVEYSINDGSSWNYLSTLTTDNYGIFSWTFTAPSAGRYLVRVTHNGLSIAAYLVVLP